MKLGGHEYMMVQQIYTTFGPAASVLEPGAIVVSAVLAFLVRRRWPPFALTFGAAVALAAALGVWGALVYPVNQRWAELPPGALPPDWQVLRARWEYGHVAHAVLLALGFAALVTSVLVDTVPWRASGRGVRDDVRRVA
ncbi:MAG: hypothetical protein DMD90_19565 [Candidatus Rokuibacteriota bacterium]|nr:MAG: hypothetical protein AUH76_08555 [Candidatus Rokubacteria bacterium 13_1_40CM_4_67_11]PYN62799.1 MAG: hypothetical protein DMD90_19565 [Candidatus Rokubacteria bacterium]